MSKYNAKKTIVDGVTFDSIAESKYYEQLKWMKKSKAIKDFKIQPTYILQDAFSKNGKKYMKITYIADFEIINNDNSIEVVDIKGMVTPVFQLKRKIFEKKFPYKLTLLKHVKKYGGFIELDDYNKRKREERKMKK